MSALGHKQTYAPQKAMSALAPIATAKADSHKTVMSALPPKADICSALAHVCFGPIADIALAKISQMQHDALSDAEQCEKELAFFIMWTMSVIHGLRVPQ